MRVDQLNQTNVAPISGDVVTIATSDIDALWNEADTQSQQWGEAEAEYLNAKVDFDAWAAASMEACRATGLSVAASKVVLEAMPEWKTKITNVNALNVAEKIKRRDFQKAMVKMELWKTCQVNLRGLTQ